jgi:hypothetical protein
MRVVRSAGVQSDAAHRHHTFETRRKLVKLPGYGNLKRVLKIGGSNVAKMKKFCVIWVE